MPADQIGEAVGDPTPDVVEAIVGWRAWRWDDRGLASITKGTRWLPGEALRAECVQDTPMWGYARLASWGFMSHGESHATPQGHATPGRPEDHPGEHACGVYAYSTPEACWENLGDSTGDMVLGQVLLSGRVFTHEHGYRAERARVGAICRPVKKPTATIWGDPIEALARFYGVPVIDFPLIASDRDRIDTEKAEKAAAAAAAQLAAMSKRNDHVAQMYKDMWGSMNSISPWSPAGSAVVGSDVYNATFTADTRSRLRRVLSHRALLPAVFTLGVVVSVVAVATGPFIPGAIGGAAMGVAGPQVARHELRRWRECRDAGCDCDYGDDD